MLTLKRLCILLIALVICIPNAQARKKKPKSGKIENLVYTDSKYNFQLTLLDNWKARLKKLDDNYRLVLIQENYQIPPDYADSPDYTLVPRLTIYVAETNVSPFELLDSLLSVSYSSDLKKDIIKEFEILNNQSIGEGERENVITRKRKSYRIDDIKGVLWQGKVKYVNKVIQSASTGSGKRIYGAYMGGVVILQIEKNRLLLFHVISEDQYFPMIWTEAMKVVGSFKKTE
ncbi:MAG: hypothetical protein DRP47_04295 [Candidatus Zixiibacteriota bacterium]|nr:MAG: hypothetical protein DRP47_04295 [candidate division Zixibacteria bacterium]